MWSCLLTENSSPDLNCSMIRYGLLRCTKRHHNLKNRVGCVKDVQVFAAVRRLETLCKMVEDFLPNLTSASGTQLEVSLGGARRDLRMTLIGANSARLQRHVDVGRPFYDVSPIWLGPESPG